MPKIKCKVCANEKVGFCKVKKVSVKLNKARQCEAYVYEETKVKDRQEIPVTRQNYTNSLELRKQRKDELKALKEAMKNRPNNGTAKDLGLMSEQDQKNKIIKPGDSKFIMPNANQKYPLTGDLSRFKTTANDGNREGLKK